MTEHQLLTGSNFTPLDWAIVGVYLAATVAIGVYVNRYIRGMEEFLVADRSLKSAISVATMVGSELGLVTVMYAAQKGFTGGFAAMHIGLIAGVATLMVGMTGFIVVPLRERGVMTIPEFYGRRFGTGVRVYGGLLLALAGILNMGLFLRAGALFVTALTGLGGDTPPDQIPMAANLVMTVLLLLVLAYTVLGGMVSVVITDYLQFVFLSIGMLIACVLAWQHFGWDELVNVVTEVHGAAGLDPMDSEGFGPSYMVWMLFTAGVCSCALWQTAVMRACAADSTATVRRLYMFSSIGFLIRFMIPQFLGVCALAWFWQAPEAREGFFTDGALIDDPNRQLQAMPLFLAQLLPPGLIGLIGAGMLAAFMSTHDSYLLCWASVLAYDVAGPAWKLTDRKALLLTRILIVLIGGFLLVWSLWFPLQQDLWDYMAVTGAIYFTGAFALVVGGLYWKRASRVGAYLALTAGAGSILGLSVIQEKLGLTPDNLGFELSGDVVGLSTAVAAVLLMLVGSLLFPDPRDSGEPA